MIKKYIPIFALVFLMFFLGCTAKTVQNGDTVTVNYVARYQDGTIFDFSGETPLTFVVGSGQVIEGFNYAVIGMKEGETKTVNVTPERGYGLSDESLMRVETLEALSNAGYDVEIGTVVSVGTGNNTINGRITEINSTHAIIDFNHPLAGKTLVFEITLVGIE